MTKQKATNTFIIRQFKRIACTLVVFLIAAGYFFIVKPERAKLSEKVTNDIALVIQEKQTKEAILNRLRRRLNEFSILQKHQSEVLERMLPSLSEKEEASSSLASVALAMNSYITNLKIENTMTAEEYFGTKLDAPLAIRVVPVSATIKGPVVTYEKMKRLLAALHDRYGVFNIKEFEFGKDAGSGQTEAESEVQLAVDLFFADDKETKEQR